MQIEGAIIVNGWGYKADLEEQVQLAIIGCGAVAQERHIPACQAVSKVDLVYVVDVDIKRAKEIARRFRIPNYVDDYHEILDEVRAVIIATPPKTHVEIAMDCLKNGVHVLCEKPLASSSEEAQKIIEVSRKSQAHLAIGMNRRLCPSSQLAKSLIESNFVGEIERFEIEEGHEFNWPLRSGHLFIKDLSIGGVLADTGPHVFDLLFWLLGCDDAEIVKYTDDNFGGVEANALIELTLKRNSKEIPGSVELSFTRELTNRIVIYGENGCIKIPVLGGQNIMFRPKSGLDHDLLIRAPANYPSTRIAQFALQLSNFVDSILTGEIKYVPGVEALPVIRAIEECYRKRTVMLYDWEAKWIEFVSRGDTDG